MRYFLFFSTLFLSLASYSQIVFEHDSLLKVLEKAKAENKIVFVDVYATWCGPCKAMSNNVFSQKAVGDYYNENFINVKIDGEKLDGPGIMAKYKIGAFPTLLFLKPDGSVVLQNVGAIMDPNLFISKGKEAIDPTSSPVYQARKAYHSSARTREDKRAYLFQLMTNQSDSLDFYATEYFNLYPDLNLSDNLDFNIFYLKESNIYSAASGDFLAHPERTDSKSYISKISSFVQSSFARAVQLKDFALVEKDVRYLYPYMAKSSPQNGDVESYLSYVRSEFNKATGLPVQN